MKKRSQSVNVKHRKISFGDFQTETIGISVKKILIEVPCRMIMGISIDTFLHFSPEQIPHIRIKFNTQSPYEHPLEV